MKHPTPSKSLLIGGASLILLSAGGLWLATRAPSQAPAAETHDDHEAEDAHADEAEGMIALTPAQIEAAGIEVAPATPGGGTETHLSGRVEPMIDAHVAVAAMVGGRIERVLVTPGQSVHAGQTLAVVISGEAATLHAETEAAAASAEAARETYRRDRTLYEAGVVARQDVEASRARSLSADAQMRAARARAAAAGTPDTSGRVHVTSPLSGVVTGIGAGPGGFVAAGGVIADITDPARTELVFRAPAQLAGDVRPGATIRVTHPGGAFTATVTGTASDTSATVIRARAQDASLPPGTAVTGVIVTGAQDGTLTVPSEAVQTVENRSVVFVRTPQGFRVVPVLAGRQAGGRTEILRGLSGAEAVAGAGAFLLKAELAKGEAGHSH